MMIRMICFVYRSPYEGVLGKHVRWLPDATVLDWFRRAWDEAAADPDAWLLAELGVEVYGLDSVFEAAAEHRLLKPDSTKRLRKLLNEHLYVERKVRADELGVRAVTDDDENPLAYFFLDRHLFDAHPDRLAYLAHEDWPLPSAAPEPSDTAPLTTVVMSRIGDVDWDTQMDVVRFPGVRLPELARHLRETDAVRSGPAELVVLRAAVGPDDDLEQALRLVNRWSAWRDQAPDVDGLKGQQAEAHRIAVSVAGAVDLAEVPGPIGTRRPGLGRVAVAPHLAQAVFHLHDEFGYQQFFAFDDVWAANHRHLASSLLRWYGGKWDPLKGVA
jgi:hypothetical protein